MGRPVSCSISTAESTTIPPPKLLPLELGGLWRGLRFSKRPTALRCSRNSARWSLNVIASRFRTTMGRIILARSGMTEYDEDERIAGSLDMPLSPKGQAEAEDLARDLKSFQVEAVYAAAGEAPQATAKLIAEEHDLKVRQLPDL